MQIILQVTPRAAKGKGVGVWPPHLGLPEEELQVSAAQDAVVLDVAGEVHGAGAVHGAVDLHVAVDRVQVFLFVLEQRGRPLLSYSAVKTGPGELLFPLPDRPSGHKQAGLKITANAECPSLPDPWFLKGQSTYNSHDKLVWTR